MQFSKLDPVSLHFLSLNASQMFNVVINMERN